MTALIGVGIAALAVSLLTLFSGFGLGTLLLPVFALFLPADVAVASTAVVHAANNLFKVGLLAGSASRGVLLRFGVPAVVASFAGALALTQLSGSEPLYAWSLAGHRGEATALELVMGLLILGFAAFELVPWLRDLQAPVRWLPVGGALSGFFGGLSGHQGALRAVFLTPLALTPAQFAATQAVLALMVDAARLLVYGTAFLALGEASARIPWTLVGVATLCAFVGAWWGRRLLPKVTIEGVRALVGVLLVVVGVALALGVA